MLSNIKYELHELEGILSQGGIADVSVEKFSETVHGEVERIRQTLIHEVFTFSDERHLERYIQYHQQALIRLMDKIALLTSGEPVEREFFFRVLYESFEIILSFIERHFTKYFDQDTKVPEGYLSILKEDVKINVATCQKGFTSKQVDERVVDLMFHVLKEIVDGGAENDVTYRKVLYVKEIQKELFQLLDTDFTGEALNEELRQVMYYLNYNSTKVLTYHAHYITALLDQAEMRAEKIEQLSFELKKIIQAQVKPGISYNQAAPSLKSQLVDYVTVELEYQERLQQLTGRGSDPPSGNFLDGFKLKFGASVAQLAYLLKVFIETKIIVNNNMSQLIHFIVRFAITKKSESISYSSLRSKFYTIEHGTKESVRTMLVNMIQYIDKN